MKEKRLLVEGYKALKKGSVRLSGKWNSEDEVLSMWLQNFCDTYGADGTAEIVFRPITDKGKALVQKELFVSYQENAEGYVVDIDDTITIYADTKRAQLYAVCYLLSMYDGSFQKGIYYNYPNGAHRSARVFFPPKKDLPYFKKFIDMLVYLGYNALLLEVGGVMEFKKHPEINETWAAYCKSMREEDDKPYTAGGRYCRTQNSVHTYNADGDIYTQEEVKELLAYCNDRCIEVIPEVPSLTHSEYILLSHPELRECEDEGPGASTACPSNPALYELVGDLYEEVIDVFKPSVLHIGHDEWWVMCVCDKCRNKNAAELYVQDVMWSYRYLKERGIQTMMWADKLIRVAGKNGETHGGAAKDVYHMPTGKTVDIMGEKVPMYKRYWFDAPEEVRKNGIHQLIHDVGDCADMLPDDIWYLNWYWVYEPKFLNDFLARGRKMIYANCYSAGLQNTKQRFAAGATGISVSDWLCTTEDGLQRWNTLYDLGYGAAICWGHTREEWTHEQNNADVFRELYRFRNHDIRTSDHVEVKHRITKHWEQGEAFYENIPFANEEKMTIGHYEVTYTDGRTEQFPVLYTLNIGTKDAVSERYEHPLEWRYEVDKHLTTVASVCDIEKAEDGIWYKTVFPVKGEVTSCSYVPKQGTEGYVEVADISIKEGEKNNE